MHLKTRLTAKLGIQHPILLAPMNVFAGGRLAAAVSAAGGLGIIGGGYGDADWLEKQFAAAGSARVGCGFITWSMARDPKLLEGVLARQPAALMLSFGEVEPRASRVKALGVTLICQVQSMKYLREAVAAGADIIVAEGCEAGGHSGYRGVFTLVPEAADYLAKFAPDTVLVAAGGVGDGRGLAAALMLGADGALVGTRFVASQESEAPEGLRQAIIRADGDSTMKSTSVDVARRRYWPNPEFVIRVLNNSFVAKWHGRNRELENAFDVEYQRFWDAFKAGDADNTLQSRRLHLRCSVPHREWRSTHDRFPCSRVRRAVAANGPWERRDSRSRRGSYRRHGSNAHGCSGALASYSKPRAYLRHACGHDIRASPCCRRHDGEATRSRWPC